MSVIKSKRNEAKTEFQHTARKLLIYTFQRCTHLPNRYWKYCEDNVIPKAAKISDCVDRANQIYPLNRGEAQKRRNHFLDAAAEIAPLVKQIEFLSEVIGVEKVAKAEWLDLVDEEDRLLKSIMKKDRERYKNLPE